MKLKLIFLCFIITIFIIWLFLGLNTHKEGRQNNINNCPLLTKNSWFNQTEKQINIEGGLWVKFNYSMIICF